MKNKILEIKDNFLTEIKTISSAEMLNDLRVKYLVKKAMLTILCL